MHPILFKIGPVTLYSYGALVATGFIVALLVALNQAKKQNISKENILDIGFYILISAIVGSRLLFVPMDYEHYLKNPLDIFKIWEGGLVYYGGLLFAIPAVIIYCRKKVLSLWGIADIFAPSIAIGHAIGRLGCFSAGCCYGKPSDLPWAVTFTDPYSFAIRGIPLHPTQLYEAIGEFSIFIFLILWRKRKSFDGELFGLYVLLYSFIRFINEFFRGDPRGFIYNGISLSQAISIMLFLGAIIFIRIKRKDYEKRRSL